MKLRIAIVGPKVHDVGYRPWLIELAMSMSLKGFDVYNDEEDGQQMVIALIEADDRRIQRFLGIVNEKRPLLAKVSSIISGDYSDEIMPLWQTAAMNAYGQMNKAIPIIQKMGDDIAVMKDDLKVVKKNTDIIPQMAKNNEKILEVVKGFREEIQPGLGEQLRQMQADIRALKDRVGML
jgi:hydrogenase maturation factor HypF (carbamoyltransferase family)